MKSKQSVTTSPTVPTQHAVAHAVVKKKRIFPSLLKKTKTNKQAATRLVPFSSRHVQPPMNDVEYSESRDESKLSSLTDPDGVMSELEKEALERKHQASKRQNLSATIGGAHPKKLDGLDSEGQAIEDNSIKDKKVIDMGSGLKLAAPSPFTLDRVVVNQAPKTKQQPMEMHVAPPQPTRNAVDPEAESPARTVTSVPRNPFDFLSSYLQGAPRDKPVAPKVAPSKADNVAIVDKVPQQPPSRPVAHAVGSAPPPKASHRPVARAVGEVKHRPIARSVRPKAIGNESRGSESVSQMSVAQAPVTEHIPPTAPSESKEQPSPSSTVSAAIVVKGVDMAVDGKKKIGFDKVRALLNRVAPPSQHPDTSLTAVASSKTLPSLMDQSVDDESEARSKSSTIDEQIALSKDESIVDKYSGGDIVSNGTMNSYCNQATTAIVAAHLADYRRAVLSKSPTITEDETRTKLEPGGATQAHVNRHVDQVTILGNSAPVVRSSAVPIKEETLKETSSQREPSGATVNGENQAVSSQKLEPGGSQSLAGGAASTPMAALRDYALSAASSAGGIPVVESRDMVLSGTGNSSCGNLVSSGDEGFVSSDLVPVQTTSAYSLPWASSIQQQTSIESSLALVVPHGISNPTEIGKSRSQASESVPPDPSPMARVPSLRDVLEGRPQHDSLPRIQSQQNKQTQKDPSPLAKSHSYQAPMAAQLAPTPVGKVTAGGPRSLSRPAGAIEHSMSQPAPRLKVPNVSDTLAPASSQPAPTHPDPSPSIGGRSEQWRAGETESLPVKDSSAGRLTLLTGKCDPSPSVAASADHDRRGPSSFIEHRHSIDAPDSKSIAPMVTAHDTSAMTPPMLGQLVPYDLDDAEVEAFLRQTLSSPENMVEYSGEIDQLLEKLFVSDRPLVGYEGSPQESLRRHGLSSSPRLSEVNDSANLIETADEEKLSPQQKDATLPAWQTTEINQSGSSTLPEKGANQASAAEKNQGDVPPPLRSEPSGHSPGSMFARIRPAFEQAVGVSFSDVPSQHNTFANDATDDSRSDTRAFTEGGSAVGTRSTDGGTTTHHTVASANEELIQQKSPCSFSGGFEAAIGARPPSPFSFGGGFDAVMDNISSMFSRPRPAPEQGPAPGNKALASTSSRVQESSTERMLDEKLCRDEGSTNNPKTSNEMLPLLLGGQVSKDREMADEIIDLSSLEESIPPAPAHEDRMSRPASESMAMDVSASGKSRKAPSATSTEHSRRKPRKMEASKLLVTAGMGNSGSNKTVTQPLRSLGKGQPSADYEERSWLAKKRAEQKVLRMKGLTLPPTHPEHRATLDVARLYETRAAIASALVGANDSIISDEMSFASGSVSSANDHLGSYRAEIKEIVSQSSQESKRRTLFDRYDIGEETDRYGVGAIASGFDSPRDAGFGERVLSATSEPDAIEVLAETPVNWKPAMSLFEGTRTREGVSQQKLNVRTGPIYDFDSDSEDGIPAPAVDASAVMAALESTLPPKRPIESTPQSPSRRRGRSRSRSPRKSTRANAPSPLAETNDSFRRSPRRSPRSRNKPKQATKESRLDENAPEAGARRHRGVDESYFDENFDLPRVIALSEDDPVSDLDQSVRNFPMKQVLADGSVDVSGLDQSRDDNEEQQFDRYAPLVAMPRNKKAASPVERKKKDPESSSPNLADSVSDYKNQDSDWSEEKSDATSEKALQTIMNSCGEVPFGIKLLSALPWAVTNHAVTAGKTEKQSNSNSEETPQNEHTPRITNGGTGKQQHFFGEQDEEDHEAHLRGREPYGREPSPVNKKKHPDPPADDSSDDEQQGKLHSERDALKVNNLISEEVVNLVTDHFEPLHRMNKARINGRDNDLALLAANSEDSNEMRDRYESVEGTPAVDRLGRIDKNDCGSPLPDILSTIHEDDTEEVDRHSTDEKMSFVERLFQFGQDAIGLSPRSKEELGGKMERLSPLSKRVLENSIKQAKISMELNTIHDASSAVDRLHQNERRSRMAPEIIDLTDVYSGETDDAVWVLDCTPTHGHTSSLNNWKASTELHDLMEFASFRICSSGGSYDQNRIEEQTSENEPTLLIDETDFPGSEEYGSKDGTVVVPGENVAVVDGQCKHEENENAVTDQLENVLFETDAFEVVHRDSVSEGNVEESAQRRSLDTAENAVKANDVPADLVALNSEESEPSNVSTLSKESLHDEELLEPSGEPIVENRHFKFEFGEAENSTRAAPAKKSKKTGSVNPEELRFIKRTTPFVQKTPRSPLSLADSTTTGTTRRKGPSPEDFQSFLPKTEKNLDSPRSLDGKSATEPEDVVEITICGDRALASNPMACFGPLGGFLTCGENDGKYIDVLASEKQSPGQEATGDEIDLLSRISNTLGKTLERKVSKTDIVDDIFEGAHGLGYPQGRQSKEILNEADRLGDTMSDKDLEARLAEIGSKDDGDLFDKVCEATESFVCQSPTDQPRHSRPGAPRPEEMISRPRIAQSDTGAVPAKRRHEAPKPERRPRGKDGGKNSPTKNETEEQKHGTAAKPTADSCEGTDPITKRNPREQVHAATVPVVKGLDVTIALATPQMHLQRDVPVIESAVQRDVPVIESAVIVHGIDPENESSSDIDRQAPPVVSGVTITSGGESFCQQNQGKTEAVADVPEKDTSQDGSKVPVVTLPEEDASQDGSEVPVVTGVDVEHTSDPNACDQSVRSDASSKSSSCKASVAPVVAGIDIMPAIDEDIMPAVDEDTVDAGEVAMEKSVTFTELKDAGTSTEVKVEDQDSLKSQRKDASTCTADDKEKLEQEETESLERAFQAAMKLADQAATMSSEAIHVSPRRGTTSVGESRISSMKPDDSEAPTPPGETPSISHVSTMKAGADRLTVDVKDHSDEEQVQRKSSASSGEGKEQESDSDYKDATDTDDKEGTSSDEEDADVQPDQIDDLQPSYEEPRDLALDSKPPDRPWNLFCGSQVVDVENETKIPFADSLGPVLDRRLDGMMEDTSCRQSALGSFTQHVANESIACSGEDSVLVASIKESAKAIAIDLDAQCAGPRPLDDSDWHMTDEAIREEARRLQLQDLDDELSSRRRKEKRTRSTSRGPKNRPNLTRRKPSTTNERTAWDPSTIDSFSQRSRRTSWKQSKKVPQEISVGRLRDTESMANTFSEEERGIPKEIELREEDEARTSASFSPIARHRVSPPISPAAYSRGSGNHGSRREDTGNQSVARSISLNSRRSGGSSMGQVRVSGPVLMPPEQTKSSPPKSSKPVDETTTPTSTNRPDVLQEIVSSDNDEESSLLLALTRSEGEPAVAISSTDGSSESTASPGSPRSQRQPSTPKEIEIDHSAKTPRKEFTRSPRLQTVLERLRSRQRFGGDQSVASTEAEPVNVDELFSRYDNIVKHMVVLDDDRLQRAQQKQATAAAEEKQKKATGTSSKATAASKAPPRKARSSSTPSAVAPVTAQPTLEESRAPPRSSQSTSRPPSSAPTTIVPIPRPNSFGSETSTPSQKARDLRKQLDEALKTSQAIRTTQERLGAELDTIKSRFQSKIDARSSPKTPSSEKTTQSSPLFGTANAFRDTFPAAVAAVASSLSELTGSLHDHSSRPSPTATENTVVSGEAPAKKLADDVPKEIERPANDPGAGVSSGGLSFGAGISASGTISSHMSSLFTPSAPSTSTFDRFANAFDQIVNAHHQIDEDNVRLDAVTEEDGTESLARDKSPPRDAKSPPAKSMTLLDVDDEDDEDDRYPNFEVISPTKTRVDDSTRKDHPAVTSQAESSFTPTSKRSVPSSKQSLPSNTNSSQQMTEMSPIYSRRKPTTAHRRDRGPPKTSDVLASILTEADSDEDIYSDGTDALSPSSKMTGSYSTDSDGDDHVKKQQLESIIDGLREAEQRNQRK